MIEDTTKREPLLHMAGLLGGSEPYITGMEAAGQRQMVNSTKLPTDFNYSKREDFEALGFVFGEADTRDPMFQEATLPDGWSRKGSDHAMWSYVVDQRGFERVAIFYKAAFYDRSAHMSLVNVGGDLANKVIYGDSAEVSIPWDQLTDDEAADAIKRAERYLEDAERHPDIYGDKAHMAQAVIDSKARTDARS